MKPVKRILAHRCSRCGSLYTLETARRSREVAERCCACSTPGCKGWGNHSGPGYDRLCYDCYVPHRLKRLRALLEETLQAIADLTRRSDA